MAKFRIENWLIVAELVQIILDHTDSWPKQFTHIVQTDLGVDQIELWILRLL